MLDRLPVMVPLPVLRRLIRPFTTYTMCPTALHLPKITWLSAWQILTNVLYGCLLSAGTRKQERVAYRAVIVSSQLLQDIRCSLRAESGLHHKAQGFHAIIFAAEDHRSLWEFAHTFILPRVHPPRSLKSVCIKTEGLQLACAVKAVSKLLTPFSCVRDETGAGSWLCRSLL